MTATIHPPERIGAIEVLRGLTACKKPSIRSFREWIEAEFRIPDGPFKGRLFRVRRQPYAGLWIDAVDSDQYNRFASVGPTQSGKTLLCSVAIAMFYLFECGENVGFGLPDMRMAGDKWRQDLLPAIKASRYAALLPTKGKGSRGGNVEEIHFKNGVVLKFVSGGSRGARGDKGRAGFTCRIMILTEVDGYDTASGTSREADPVTQLEARTRAYDSRKRFFMECTASIPTGRIWREYTTGTQSVIVGQCPHCAEWVAPGPGDLQGWEDAKHEIEARENGHFICPECDEVLTEKQRRVMNEKSRLIHKGQKIEDGEVVGDHPPTQTLGFRWSAWENMFAQIGTLAVDSYLASVNADVEASEKKQNQFVWALPWEPKSVGLSAITQTGVLARSVGEPRLVIPPQCSAVTVGADVRKMEIHWTVIAWCENKSQIVDYGVVENPTNLPLELAIREGLRDLKNEIVDPGWTDASGNHYPAARVMVDSGWQWETIDAACAAMGSRWMPVKGFGGLERHKYAAPLKRGGVITRLGECYHVSRAEHRQTFLASIDTGYWKSWLFERLSTEIGQIGAMTLFQAQEVELLQFAHHITAERQVEGPEGEILWKLISRHNHWLDATAYACVAGHFEGIRLFQEPSATRGPVTDWFKNVKKRGRR